MTTRTKLDNMLCFDWPRRKIALISIAAATLSAIVACSTSATNPSSRKPAASTSNTANVQVSPTLPTSAQTSSLPVSNQSAVQGFIGPDRLMPMLGTNEINGTSNYGSHPQLKALASQLAQTYLLDEQWVLSALSQARFNANVAKLIMPAANPGAKNWAVYRSRFVEPIRIRKGMVFWNTYQNTLQKAAQQYGVPANIIAGIIGVETIYGQQTGQFRVLDALSTLTLDFPVGRKDRSVFFRTQLGEFLRLCAEQKWDPREVRGSYAGAMGWPQFMPSSIRQYAVDFDGDGHIDLTKSVPDVIGSVANFLAKHGWQPGQATHFNVQAPTDLDSLAYLLGPDIVPTFKPLEMTKRGAVLDKSGQEHPSLLALVKLENAGAAPTYIAGTDNFYVITRYNNSSYYALSVIDLAKAISP
jgi:membrane-bound lytic murein transglycosylase B